MSEHELQSELSLLAHVLRHDLREPVRAVQGFSRSVAERCCDGIDERSRDRLGRVVEAATRLDALASALALYLDARCLDPRRETVPGRALAEDAARSLDALCAEHGARIEIAEDLPGLDVDRRWATEALARIIENGVVFGGEPAPRVRVGALEGATGFLVRDEGDGFAADPESVFPLFRRAVGRQVPGLGAGLAIARAVARRHGGDAWVRHSGPAGSEVAIVF